MRHYSWLLLIAATAQAAVVRIEVIEQSSPGGYRRTVGKVHYAVDPQLPANRSIADLDRAPRNDRGLVEFTADLDLREPERPSGRLLVEIPNRGGNSMVNTFNRGDQLLLEQGFTLAWIGWQPDVAERPGAFRLHAPIARGVTGPVRVDFVPDRRATSFSLAEPNHVAYTVADGPRSLSVRDSVDGPRREIPLDQWRIADGRVEVPGGLEPGRIYEVVYTARDPWVAGLGFASVRDLVSYLKTDRKLKYAYGFGNSQSAMYLRAMVADGFNLDEGGARVFDGILANVAGGRRVNLNRRFSQPARTAGPFRAFLSRTDIPPFSERDVVKPPKILYSNSAYEYWGAAASLVHTNLDGTADLAPVSTSRVYMFAGGQHGPSRYPPSKERTQNLANPNDYRWALRALLVALVKWVEEDREPPASRYPSIQNRDLVPFAKLDFPHIPGVNLPPRVHTPARLLDDSEPPKLGPEYRTLVPAVDKDGNDRAGIRMPEIEAPVATYTGWNLTASGELTNNSGSFIPFTKSRQEREARGDPRLSLDERYASRDEYLKRFRAAAVSLAKQGYLLERDVDAVAAHAERLWPQLTSSR